MTPQSYLGRFRTYIAHFHPPIDPSFEHLFDT